MHQRPTHERAAKAAACVIAIALLLAACGGNGSHHAKTTRPSAASTSNGIAFSRCMRTHGFPQFPDVQAGAGLPIEHTDNGGTDIIINGVGQPVNAPALNAAMAKCARYMVNLAGTAVSSSQVSRINHALLQAAECMRSHGVPQFPDPVPLSRQSQHMNPIAQAKAAGINIYSPAFKAAHEICGSSLRAAMNSG